MGGGEQAGRSNCPRDLVRIVLNHTLAHTGIAFPAPGESTTATSDIARSIAAQVN